MRAKFGHDRPGRLTKYGGVQTKGRRDFIYSRRLHFLQYLLTILLIGLTWRNVFANEPSLDVDIVFITNANLFIIWRG